MLDFWSDRLIASPLLAAYALRLALTTANTVALERSFSALKFIQTRLRNRLTLERLNKLIFIYMNRRTLAQEGPRLTCKRKRLSKH